MNDNNTRTQERIEQAVAAHLDSCTPERYAYIMKHIGPWTDGYLTRDAEPTTVSAEQIEKAAIAHYTGDKLDPGRDWRDVPDIYRGHMLAEMERSFRATGFRIEGDEA